MTLNLPVGTDVKQLIDEIIAKNNWKSILEIRYEQGSEIAEGLTANTVAVNIITPNETFYLYLKCDLDMKILDFSTEIYFRNEIYFYEHVYPAYSEFLKEKRLENFFTNVPKCYGTKKNVIALENLKTKGFKLFDRTIALNNNHIRLVMKTFAKFHAVSFAFKDQRKEIYEEMVGNTFDIFSNTSKDSSMYKKLKNLANYFVGTLNRIEDKHIIDKCSDLGEKLVACFATVEENLNEYSILTQGDCWANNMMFLYKNDDNHDPLDIMLVDFQMLRPASPVFDISYFFYTIAADEALSKLDCYLELYQEELSNGIKLLGSDPEILYPRKIFMREWKQHAKYGFAMAFMFVRMMLPTIETEAQKAKSKQDLYVERLKSIAVHMVENDII